MSDYTLKFTDTSLPAIAVAAYHVDGPTSPLNATPFDHTYLINPPNAVHYPITSSSPSTTLVLTGRGVTGYGQFLQQNLIYMLEHFSNATPPVRPVVGQQWFDRSTNVMNVWTTLGAWEPISNQPLLSHFTRYHTSPSVPQNTFTVPPYTMGGNRIWVFVDGAKQIESLHYSETDNHTITFTASVNAGSNVEFIYM